MKKIKYISLLITFTLGITLFFACKKVPDRPPVNAITAGGIYTISQLRALYTGTTIKFTQDISLYATVTMTDNYKTLYLRDNTGAISLKQLTAHGIYQGDSLRINLNGSYLDLSGVGGSLQIDSVDVSSSPTNKVVKLDVGKNPNPIDVSVLQLNNSIGSLTYSAGIIPHSIYDGQLVRVNDIQFAVSDSGYYIPLNTSSTYTTHALYDCGALNTITLSLYTGTADFLYQKVPNTKSGYMIAAASFYSGSLQLTPRSFHEISFTQSRCGVDTLTQSFNNPSFGSNVAFSSTLFPGWFDINQVGTSITWEGYQSGSIFFPYASTNFSINPRNVTWIITPAIQNSPTKNLSFQAGTAYNTNGFNQLSVLVSTDFVGTSNIGGSNYPCANPAHWTDITAAFTGIPTNNVSSAFIMANASVNPVMLSQYAPVLAGYTGTFYIGFRYTGNKVDSVASYAISNVVIKN